MSTDTPTDDGVQETTPATVLGRVEESVCAFDTDWEFTYVNQQAASLFDRKPETLLGETLWEQLPAVADSKAYGALHDALEQQDSQQFDMRYDPHDTWVTVRAYPSADGLTVCFDERSGSQWRQLERQRSQRLFESVFDETNDALIVADTDRRITDFNPAAERLFGYDASEVIGEQSEILYADTETFEEQGEQRFNEQATERHDRYVVEYERADGTTFEGETMGTPLEGEDGEPFAFFATVRDVTSRLKYERDVERRNRVLKRFHGITTDESERFEQQVTAVLELTCNYLGLDNGMLAEIEGNEYTVRQAVTDGEPMAAGTTFALEETFCERVIDSDGPVGFPSAAAGEMTTHPAYQSQDVEAYLGAPVSVDGNSYGTVNFSSSDPRAKEISESEETFVRIVSQWLGKEMSRRQNRERADRERERLRQIVDMLPQLVFVKDESGAFLLANEAVAEAYGTTVDELEDSFDADFAENEKEAEQFRADDRAVIESGEAKYIPEEPLTTADGTERILATRKIPYDPVDTDGDAVLGVSTDITELKEREAELEMQSAAMEASMDGISILDADGEYIYMNDAHASVFDHAPDELIGSSWRRVYGEVEVERLEQDVFPELERTGQWRGETVGRRRDGTPVDQEITLSLLDDGKLICTNRDITARKARESELEQYEALIENMNESAFIVDNDSQLVYANEQALAYAGATADAVLGHDVGTLVQEMVTDEAAANAFVDALDATLDGVQVDERYEVPLETPTGEYVLEYMFAPFSSDGRHRAAIVARDVTEQNAREQELERKQSRLRALFDESPDGIIVHDERGAILDANTTQAELLSYDLDELRSLNVAKIEAGLGRSELRALWESMDIGETKKVEGNHRRKHGSIYPVEVWVSKTQVLGQPRFIAVSRDITERKAREADLVRNREFLEKTQEIAAVGGWEIDLRRDKLQWTDEVYRIHDLPLDAEVTVEDGIDFYHPDDRATIVDAYEQLVEAGEPYDMELRIITAGGETKWVRTVADPQFEDGAVVSVRGIFQDITDRKERERDVRELTERLDLAVEGANLGVWDWDMTTDEVTFNEQWATMLGLSLEEVEPTLAAWEERVHPADMDRVEDALAAHMRGEAALYDCEHRMRVADGGWKWIRDVGEVVERDENGDPTRAVGIHLDISDQKETERTLEDERDMFAQGPAVVFKWQNEASWPVEYVSENVAETLGYTQEQLESGEVPYETLIHDEDMDRVTREVEAHTDDDTERFSHDPYRMVTADGSVRWVTDNTKIIREGGEITHYLGYLVDVTDRKRLEQSLRENEQSIRDVTTVAADTDRSFQEKLTAILDIGCERLGLPLGFLNKLDSDTQNVIEAVGSHPDIQAGESAPRSKAYCRKTVEQDVPLTVQNAVNEGWEDDPAYEAFDLGCYIGGQVVVNGDTYGSLCFADREGRDKQFDELEQAFVELLVQWVSYELASQKVETKLRELNETAQRLLSAGDADEVTSIAIESANEVLGLPLTGIWYYDESIDTLVPDGVTDEVRDVLDEQPAFTGDGSLAWETFQRGEVGVYDDLHDQDDRYNEETPLESEIIVPLGGHGVMISGAETQRAFSETDVGLFEILGATVETALERAEREQVLRDTQGQLKQSNEELEQFAYAASHDLQEPLRTVSSYLTLLERRNREALDEDAMEFIDFAIDGADRMREMIQALLEYSRVDTRRQSLERTAMQDVFETVTQNLEVSIEESGATVDIPDSATTVEGDPSQLVQLFQNLVGNGIKYCDDDPSVDISVVRSGDGVVEYAVADNGIGMAPDQIEGIFEVFQRLHTNAEFDGTGIGLSICRKIVDRHDGEIRVESTPGEGSTFFVTLPVTGQNDE